MGLSDRIRRWPCLELVSAGQCPGQHPGVGTAGDSESVFGFHLVMLPAQRVEVCH